jgi:hypothetical protein
MLRVDMWIAVCIPKEKEKENKEFNLKSNFFMDDTFGLAWSFFYFKIVSCTCCVKKESSRSYNNSHTATYTERPARPQGHTT